MVGYVYLLYDPQMFKVGQTRDLEGRRKKYRTHNPGVQWVSLLEVPDPVRIETRVLRELRLFYRQVPGTRDWFYGTLPEAAFQQAVQEALDQESIPEATAPSLDDLLNSQILGYFEGVVPLAGLIWDAFDGGMEWADYIKGLMVETLDITEVRVTLHDFASQAVLLLCVPEELSLLELIESVGNEVFDRLRPELRKQIIPPLHDTPARKLLEGDVVVMLD